MVLETSLYLNLKKEKSFMVGNQKWVKYTNVNFPVQAKILRQQGLSIHAGPRAGPLLK
jgi:hypothetical protein